MMVTNEAVDRAAMLVWSKRKDECPEWDAALDDSRWVDEVEETREATRVILEAAAPQFAFDVLMSAADDLAGDNYSSHLDKIQREFKRNDGEELKPNHYAYLDGMEESREFLINRAHDIKGEG